MKGNKLEPNEVEKITKDLIVWIRCFYANFDLDKKAVIGISGGKDSSIAANVLCRALGKDRVIGVSMPNGEQSDMVDVDRVFETLGIKRVDVNIRGAYDALYDQIANTDQLFSEDAKINLPPRLRMATLYAVAQTYNGLVVNTCNLSEDYLGYSTKWGDNAGDFSPFMTLTKTEVCQIGEYLKDLPEYLVTKVPSDGLCGKSDEDRFGFSYDFLDAYIRTGKFDEKSRQKEWRMSSAEKAYYTIKKMHDAAGHKDLKAVMSHFESNLPYFEI